MNHLENKTKYGEPGRENVSFILAGLIGFNPSFPGWGSHSQVGFAFSVDYQLRLGHPWKPEGTVYSLVYFCGFNFIGILGQ